jgi:hypothetical protein
VREILPVNVCVHVRISVRVCVCSCAVVYFTV